MQGHWTAGFSRSLNSSFSSHESFALVFNPSLLESIFLIMFHLDFRSFKIRKMQRYPLDFLSPASNSIGMFQFLLFLSAFVCRLPLFLFYSIIFTLCTFALLLQKHLCLQNLKNVSIWSNQITFTVIFLLKFLLILAIVAIFIVHPSLCVLKNSSIVIFLDNSKK